ncbi:hypothetical protein FB567DRAFT_613641 [Paraphoma chrysanthemicola]|uniref:Uncharacterized protein n=1 Tax=Paraphoma chrysanthemicola TaxID=798071 RepID=A0A8K0RAZ9_9PLEO|nr:hypothetical protein FB567DRAFT_613641 [Paraphoma chrysanthemicola]
MSKLESLADELILEVLRHLRSSRKERYEMQSNSTDIEGRSTTFSSLCSTSKRLSSIATPFLYSDIIVATNQQFEPRRILQIIRTLSDNPPLARHVNYIEHTIITCKEGFSSKFYQGYEREKYYSSADWDLGRRTLKFAASRVWTGTYHKLWTSVLEAYPEMALVALLLRLTPCVSHVYLDLFSHGSSEFWQLLSSDDNTDGNHGFTNSFFGQLKRIYANFQREAQRTTRARALPSFARFTQFLQSLPELHFLSHSGNNMNEMTDGFLPDRLSLKFVKILILDTCSIPFDEISTIIKACDGLQEFMLDLDHDQSDVYFSTIHSALYMKRETLKHIGLYIDMHPDGDFEPFAGSFAEFEKLQTLSISALVLMGIPDDFNDNTSSDYSWTTSRPSHRMSALLPSSLERLSLHSEIMADLSDDTAFLWDFIDDLDQLPQLGWAEIWSLQNSHYEKLSHAFEKHDVSFKKNTFRQRSEQTV